MIDWRDYSGRDDPEQRYALYRVCPGETEPELVSAAATPEAVGVALVTGGSEGEWEDCPFGLLDRMPPCDNCGGHGEDMNWYTGAPTKCRACDGSGIKPTGTWVILPYLSSPKNASDAGKVLRTARPDVRSAVGGK